MNCTDFELAVQNLLDDRLAELPSTLQDHAAQCAECRSFWQSQQMLIVAVRTWTPISAPTGLMQSVLSALAQPEHAALQPERTSSVAGSPRVSRGSAWAALISTAAMMLITVTMIQFAPPADPLATVETVATGSPATEPPGILVTQTLSGLWQGVHTEYQELSQGTTRVLDGLGELPESAALLPSLSAEPSTAQPTSSWLRLARPVSDRVGKAFDFLRDVVPGETPQSS